VGSFFFWKTNPNRGVKTGNIAKNEPIFSTFGGFVLPRSGFERNPKMEVKRVENLQSGNECGRALKKGTSG